MLNRIVLTGRLTRDPELRRTTSDMGVASFTIAVDDNVKGPNGEKTTTFIGVTVWDKQADTVAKFLRKGALVGVDGRIRQRTFERRDGTKASVPALLPLPKLPFYQTQQNHCPPVRRRSLSATVRR